LPVGKTRAGSAIAGHIGLLLSCCRHSSDW
jgi:hypothetical protein